MKVGVLWRKYRNVEQQMKITPDNVYDDAYEEAHHHYTALKEAGYEACMLEWNKDPKATLKNINKEKVGIVFNASSLKEVIFLEAFGIPYVGSGIDLLSMNKARRKQIVEYNKLPTARFLVAEDSNNIPDIDLKYPLFVKPIKGRGSAGITEENIINKYKDLPKVVDKITKKLEQKALIEEFIDGREITVGIIGYEKPIVLPIVEIEYNDAITNTFEHKMYDNEKIYCPARLTKEEEELVKDTALKIYKVLNAKDYSRIDMIIGKDGKPYFLEINTFAGLTTATDKDEDGNMKVHQGYIGHSARAKGMNKTDLIATILESALERYELSGIEANKTISS